MTPETATVAGRRLSLHRRNRTLAQRLLRKYDVSLREVADESCIPVATVCRTLALTQFARREYATVIHVRRAVEWLLHARGADVSPETLWQEYDQEV